MRDIEEMLTLDERSSADFILSLRKQWAATVYPAFINEFKNSGTKISSPQEGEVAMKAMSLYSWFSHLERSSRVNISSISRIFFPLLFTLLEIS